MALCVAADFDNTLARIDDPGYAGLFDIFTRRDVPEEAVRLIYDRVTALGGFSIKALFEAVREAGFLQDGESDLVSLYLASIEQEFDNWLFRHLKCYDDSIPQVREWLERGISVVIVTAGEENYQRQKIAVAQVPYTALIVVPPTSRKSRVVRELLEKYGGPIIMIDDKASELDYARKDGLLGPDVHTIWIKRPDGRHVSGGSQYIHTEVATLADPAIAALMEQ